MSLRRVKPEDAAQIAEIYNYYIKNTHHTFETEPLSGAEMQRRIIETSEKYPYLVFEDNGEILGYAYAAQFKLRQAYAYSAEASIYVKNDAKQRKIGTQLLELMNLLTKT